MFGEIVAENLPIILFQTCGGSIENIKALISNNSAPDVSRISAVDSLLYAVAEDYVSREEVLRFLSTLFTGKETDSSSRFWSLIAMYICDLCPDRNTFKIIENAYNKGLISRGMINCEEFEESIGFGYQRAIKELKQRKEQNIPDNIHEAMSWWACFEDD